MKSWRPAYIFREQQARLIAQNARQLSSVIKKNYPAATTRGQTKLNFCQDGTSTEEVLTCIWSGITNTISDPNFADNQNDTQKLMNVSHTRSS